MGGSVSRLLRSSPSVVVGLARSLGWCGSHRSQLPCSNPRVVRHSVAFRASSRWHGCRLQSARRPLRPQEDRGQDAKAVAKAFCLALHRGGKRSRGGGRPSLLPSLLRSHRAASDSKRALASWPRSGLWPVLPLLETLGFGGDGGGRGRQPRSNDQRSGRRATTVPKEKGGWPRPGGRVAKVPLRGPAWAHTGL